MVQGHLQGHPHPREVSSPVVPSVAMCRVPYPRSPIISQPRFLTVCPAQAPAPPHTQPQRPRKCHIPELRGRGSAPGAPLHGGRSAGSAQRRCGPRDRRESCQPLARWRCRACLWRLRSWPRCCCACRRRTHRLSPAPTPGRRAAARLRQRQPLPRLRLDSTPAGGPRERPSFRGPGMCREHQRLARPRRWLSATSGGLRCSERRPSC